ncbi:MAG: glycosyltransferase [Lachnospiraceae bacterium]|nr:glycosyltransferase [Lachnospiraceae bacterium]
MGRNIKFSFLLCTLNREELLRRCVNSLLEQSYDKYEIVIIDQSDNINYDYQNSECIKYYHVSEKGLSRSRNLGLQFCEGDFIALIDDDAVYDHNYLKEANETIENTNDVGILAGRIKDPITGEYLLPHMIEANTINIKWNSIFDYCMSAAMIIHKSILSDGFDMDFGIGAQYGAGEETDIVIKTLIEKKRVIYNPALIVYHKSNTDIIDYTRTYNYSVGFGALYKKYYLKNRKILWGWLYIKSLIKSMGGILLYSIGNKKYKRSLYSLKGKIDGFKKYTLGD